MTPAAKHSIRNATARIAGIMMRHCRHCPARLPADQIRTSLREIETAVKYESPFSRLLRCLYHPKR